MPLFYSLGQAGFSFVVESWFAFGQDLDDKSEQKRKPVSRRGKQGSSEIGRSGASRDKSFAHSFIFSSRQTVIVLRFESQNEFQQNPANSKSKAETATKPGAKRIPADPPEVLPDFKDQVRSHRQENLGANRVAKATKHGAKRVPPGPPDVLPDFKDQVRPHHETWKPKDRTTQQSPALPKDRPLIFLPDFKDQVRPHQENSEAKRSPNIQVHQHGPAFKDQENARQQPQAGRREKVGPVSNPSTNQEGQQGEQNVVEPNENPPVMDVETPPHDPNLLSADLVVPPVLAQVINTNRRRCAIGTVIVVLVASLAIVLGVLLSTDRDPTNNEVPNEQTNNENLNETFGDLLNATWVQVGQSIAGSAPRGLCGRIGRIDRRRLDSCHWRNWGRYE